ncbi:MAG TPA: four helix bundle protein, partial [Cyclobacteriaceae bacterium]|nr:four helix bundle protein [Cyclobacteriaceae bacterium]
SRELVKEAYGLTTQLPLEEKYELVSQIRRCVVSIPANISEGSGRNTDKDFAHFLNISLGSAYELETLLTLSFGLETYFGEAAKRITIRNFRNSKNDLRLNQDVAPRV